MEKSPVIYSLYKVGYAAGRKRQLFPKKTTE